MKIMLFANTDWYLYNFRRSLALALRDVGHEVIMVSPDGPYAEKILACGLNWVAAPMDRRSLNPVSEFSFLLWLRKFIARERFDLVHGFTIKGAVYASLAARAAHVPARISSIDGLGYVFASDDLKARILRPIVKAMLRLSLSGSASRLILQNHDDVALFSRDRLIAEENISLIRGAGVDCQRFVRGGMLEADSELRVVLAARLLWDKGIREYVEAARILKAEGRKIRFLLAGMPDPGNPDSVSEQQVRGWADEGLIDWLGHVSDMASLLQTIHVVTLPSAYREGLPTALTEGAACGLPLITTDNPGCREVVTHEVDGLLVPVRDGKALARAIARIQDNPELASRLGAAARAKASAHFDQRVVNAQTIETYANCCTGLYVSEPSESEVLR